MSEANAGTSEGDNKPSESQPKVDADPRIAELSKESASYRTQRNTALRKAAAYEAMLSAHGVKVELDADALANLPISGGKVDGQYAYTAPKIEGAKPAPRQSANTGLTIDEIKTMDTRTINSRWDEVQKVLEANKGN